MASQNVTSHIPTNFCRYCTHSLYYLQFYILRDLLFFCHFYRYFYKSLMNVPVVTFLISTKAIFSFLLVPKTCTQQQRLMGWHITLIVIGVLALVAVIVIIIIIIVVSCHQMGELYQNSPLNSHSLLISLQKLFSATDRLMETLFANTPLVLAII